MHIPTAVDHRSTGGCLTCKRRRKKCGEEKPVCRRCLNGNFQCLGYQDQAPSLPRRHGRSTNIIAISKPPPTFSNRRPQTIGVSGLRRDDSFSWNQPTPCFSVPRGPRVNQAGLGDMYSLIISQYVRLAPKIIFRPFQLSIEASIMYETKASSLRLWTLFLGAKVNQALLDSHDEKYGGLVERFHCRVRSDSTLVGMSTSDLALRLSCLENLANFAIMVFNSRAGYRLFKATVPAFLQLASRHPHLWSQNSTISISHVLYAPHYYMRTFVLWDIMVALALASPPLLQYNTRSKTCPDPRVLKMCGARALEWVFGCPTLMIFLIAKINTCWADKWSGQIGPCYEDWRELEKELKRWDPLVDYVGDSTGRVMRLAIQEAWRHAVLIYLYMGMCGADSADPRVEQAVQQVTRLATAVFPGNSLENYLFMPCLIAGIAARRESHRAILRQKLGISKNENIWCLRGADFVPVLDYLWCGAGANGYPTTWGIYAMARRTVLPMEG